MSDRDAYPSEMTNPFGPTDDELDGVFAGVAPADSLEEVAAFMLEVKTTCSDAPREEVATRHIAAMVEQSRETAGARPLIQEEVAPVDRTRWRKAVDKMIATALKGAAGVLAASMSMMGLAFAGVDLPGQAAASALEAVTGVELPNQGENENDKSVEEDVKAVIESDMEKGCEFGQTVAAAASRNANGDASGSEEEACTEADEEGGEPQGSKATGDEKSAAGRAKASENSGGASDAGAANADAGADNAAAGSDRADDGESNASTGKATAEERSSGAGSDTEGDEGDTGGQGTASEQSGGASEGGAGNADRRP